MGQWAVVSGQWSVVSGQWSVVSGQWSVGSGQWSVVKVMQSHNVDCNVEIHFTVAHKTTHFHGSCAAGSKPI